MLKKMSTKYPETYFIAKLLLLFCVFYFGSQLWIGITSKGNYYSAFADTYLNYIAWLRTSLLKAAGVICMVFGHKTAIENEISLRIIGGYKINMVYSCIGIGVMSCWAAFALAFPSQLKRKAKWLIGGLLVIWLLNSIRVAALLLLVNSTRNTKAFPQHHTVFNIVSYCIVVVMIYFYTKRATHKKDLAE